MKYKIYYTYVVLILCGLMSCQKDFLDKKSRTDIIIPNSLEELQMLLDNTEVLNLSPGIGQLASDDYYIPSQKGWQARTITERNAYLWKENVFGGEIQRRDWDNPYKTIFYSNSVLSILEEIMVKNTDQEIFNYLKGQSYFNRGMALFELVKVFAPSFDEHESIDDLGVPIRMTSNVDVLIPRSSVAENYKQLLDDIKKSIPLLPSNISMNFRNRSSRPASYGLLARVFLSMRDYEKAYNYADSCLQLYDKLNDYNTIDLNSATPFSRTNDEVILFSSQVPSYLNTTYNSSAEISIDSILFASYDLNDLRRSLFFTKNQNTGLIKAKRGYGGPGNYPFSGIAVDEIMLIKAESAVRKNKVKEAEDILNHLLIRRYRKGSYSPKEITNQKDGLDLILKERRKELVWRAGLRWDDIKRLNREGANIVLRRVLDEQHFILDPKSSNYTFNIPDDEIFN